MSRPVIAYGALVFSESTDRDRRTDPVLVASTSGGAAELSVADAAELGEQLLAWARPKMREVTS